MADGHSQIYGDCFIAFNNICRHAGTYHNLYGSNLIDSCANNRAISCI